MCRASEAFKTEVFKKAYKEIWTKNSNSMVKIKHNVSLQNLNFDFLAVVGRFKLIKKFLHLYINHFGHYVSKEKCSCFVLKVTIYYITYLLGKNKHVTP